MTLLEVNSRFLKQDAPGLHKRWFADEDTDLTVWQDSRRQLVHFQLVLNGRDMIDWERGRPVRLGLLDAAKEIGGPATPTWAFTAGADPAVLAAAAEQFERDSGELESGIRLLVGNVLIGAPVDELPPPSVPAPAEAGAEAGLHELAGPARDGTESKVIVIGLMTPYQIKNSLIDSSAAGWELFAVGTNYALLQRGPGGPLPETAYTIKSITLSLPHQIKGMLNSNGLEGRALGGIGPNFAFFKRMRNLPLEPREFEMDSVTILHVYSIQRLLEARGRQRWGLCGMGKNFAFFERFKSGSSPVWEHKYADCNMLAISDHTAAHVVEVMEQQGEEGWRPCGVDGRHIYFRRPQPFA